MVQKKAVKRVARRRSETMPEIAPVVETQTPPQSSGSGMTLLIWLLAVLVVAAFLVKGHGGCRPAEKDFAVNFVREIAPQDWKGAPYSVTTLADLGKDRFAFTDESHTQVVVAELDGKWEGTVGRKGTAREDFRHVTGLCSDSEGNLYVLDHDTADVYGFNRAGRLFLHVDSRPTGFFYGPRGLAYLKGNFGIADTGSCRVVLMDPAGKTVQKWGTRGEALEQFRSPNGIAVDAAGRILVTDFDTKRLKIQDAQGKNLKVVNLPERPITVNTDGTRAFVAFGGAHAVQVYGTETGKYLGDLKPQTPPQDGGYRNVNALCVVDGKKLVTSDGNKIWVYQIP